MHIPNYQHNCAIELTKKTIMARLCQVELGIFHTNRTLIARRCLSIESINTIGLDLSPRPSVSRSVCRAGKCTEAKWLSGSGWRMPFGMVSRVRSRDGCVR